MLFLGSKYAKIAFAAGAIPRIPLVLTAFPRSSSWIKGPTSKGRGKGGEKRGREGEGRAIGKEEGGGKGRGQEGGGKGKVAPPFSNSWIRPWEFTTNFVKYPNIFNYCTTNIVAMS